MATVNKIIPLIRLYFDKRNHAEKDREFQNHVRSLAADEARSGHSQAAGLITDALEKGLAMGGMSRLAPDIQELLEIVESKATREDLIVDETISRNISMLELEWKQRGRLMLEGLLPSHRLLFYGPPGTGKTMTAGILAASLDMPLYRVTEGMIAGVMGKTQERLSKIFRVMRELPGVYLFDEFDSIGAGRSGGQQEHAEMRRVLNTFLQLIERTDGQSVVICATNIPDALDMALFRRFDQTWDFKLPDLALRRRLIERVARRPMDDALSELTEGLSQAELTRGINQARKEAILEESETLDADRIWEILSCYKRKELSE